MMRRIIYLTIILGLGTFLTISHPSFAEESIEELKAEIHALKDRVQELEEQKTVAPSQSYQYRGWDPFAQMQRMQEEMDALFADSFNAPMHSPRGMFSSDMVFDQKINIKEKDNGYEVRFDMAGLDKDKVDIQINKNSITVSGKYSEEEKDENANGVFHSQRFGTFLKTIPLPTDADTNNVNTEQQGEELVITMPKKT